MVRTFSFPARPSSTSARTDVEDDEEDDEVADDVEIDLTQLNPLSPEVISKQATINIGAQCSCAFLGYRS